MSGRDHDVVAMPLVVGGEDVVWVHGEHDTHDRPPGAAAASAAGRLRERPSTYDPCRRIILQTDTPSRDCDLVGFAN
jgi:hypothetical protein